MGGHVKNPHRLPSHASHLPAIEQEKKGEKKKKKESHMMTIRCRGQPFYPAQFVLPEPHRPTWGAGWKTRVAGVANAAARREGGLCWRASNVFDLMRAFQPVGPGSRTAATRGHRGYVA